MWELAAPIAAFVAITQTAGGAGQNPKATRRAEAPAEDGEGRLFCFAMQRPEGPAENSRSQPLPVRVACRPIALYKAVVAPLRHWAAVTELAASMAAKRAYSTVADRSRKRETSSGAS